MKTNVTDIAGAIVWAASAVAVTGYTWDAYTKTYSRFPSAGGGGGGGSIPPAVKAAQKVGADVGKSTIKQTLPTNPIGNQGAVNLQTKPSSNVLDNAKESVIKAAGWFLSHWG